MSEAQYGVVQSAAGRLAVLKQVLIAMNLPRIDLLEIGSYEGSSALAFSKIITDQCPDGGSVLCVDPWAPYLPLEDVQNNPTCARMQEDLGSGAVFERFTHNYRLADPKCPIDFRKGTLLEVMKKKLIDADRKFDVIYVDGSHIFKDVMDDLLLTIGMVRPGGLICGDDLEKQAADLDWAHVQANRHREYVDGYHPGVTAAVHTVFGRVWCQDAVWVVQRSEDILPAFHYWKGL